ncbi:MAG: cell division protein FtsW [Actinomycetota bacterium]|jgi:cell division protein FtsW|nr:cell division protein FtsW [Actinomycetota bacterium]
MATTAARRAPSVSAAANHPSVLLPLTVGALVVTGLVMVLSASSVSSYARYGSSFLFFQRQSLWAVIGVVGYLFFARFDYRRLKGFGYVAFALVSVLLIAVLVPGMGKTVGGSSRWIGVGAFVIQPSEIAKLALILFAADVFSRREEKSFGEFANTALPMLPAMGLLAGLVMLQPDLGTTVLLGVIGFGLLFVAGAPLRHLIPMGLSGVTLAVGAGLASPYRRVRLLAFMDPWKDPLDTGYHTIQSLIALGSGGWFGVGLGASRQKWMYVPNAHTDFIYAILGEEMGLLGTLVVLGMFAFLTYLGVRIARSAPDRFGMLIASGITIWIATQALVNMGAVTAALPITGVPLPLVSFGGSSLVISLAAMGILTNIARAGKAKRLRASTARSAKAGSSARSR